jgi:hypothetical protein
MDTIAQRRMQIAKMEQDAAAADEKDKYNRSVESRKEAYGNRKQDLIEKRDTANEQFKRQEHNAKQFKYMNSQIGAGKNPGTVVIWGEDGNPIEVSGTFEGGKTIQRPAPAQDMAAPPAPAAPPSVEPPAPEPQGQPVPTMMGKPLMQSTLGEGPGQLPVQPPAPSPAPEARPEIAQASGEGQGTPADPELDALMSRASQPQEPQEPQPQAAQDNTIFLDENDEGTTRALLPPGDTGRAELPMRAYPEGAKVGDRFAAEDVNLKGGYGNPFAEPVPPIDMPQPNRDAGGTNNLLGVQSPTPTYTFVPGRNIQGASATMPQQGGDGRWVFRDKTGKEHYSIGVGEARKAKADEDFASVQAINEALGSPEAQTDPMYRQALVNRKVAVLGQMSADDRKALFAMQKQGQQIDSNEGTLDKKLAFQKEQGDLNRASKEKIAADANATRRATSKYGRGGGTSSKLKAASAADPSAEPASPWAMLDSKERTREGNRLNREKRDWANNHGWTKLLSTNTGRLDWAKDNIAMTGPGAGAAQAEAMMNLFGVARGGVPVKNETDEFYKATTSLTTHLDNIGKHIGVPQLGTRWRNGTLGDDEAKKYEGAVSAMPEDQRNAIARAIQSTSDALLRYGRKELESLKTMWDVEPLANRHKATAFINELGAHLDLPPQQWWGDVKLRGGGQAAAGGDEGGSSALEGAVLKLLQARKARK